MQILNFSVEKIDWCKNNLENSFTTKVRKDISSGFSISTISLFKSIENKHNVYKCKVCMKKFCEYLREHVTLKNIKIKFLIKEQHKSYENGKFVIFVKNIWK